MKDRVVNLECRIPSRRLVGKPDVNAVSRKNGRRRPPLTANKVRLLSMSEIGANCIAGPVHRNY